MQFAAKYIAIIFSVTAFSSATLAFNASGSYRQTCINIRLVGGTTIIADCKDLEGKYVRTSLNEADKCIGDIANQGGKLSCKKNTAGALPPGTYLRTCTNVVLSGNRLTADCKNLEGVSIRTSLDQIDKCVSEISNEGGNLFCKKNVAGALPPGTYLRTCRNAVVSGTI